MRDGAGKRPGRFQRLGLACAAVALLAACQGGLDPRDRLIPHVDQPVPGTDQPYPNLASVPSRPSPIMSSEERARVQQQLTADARSQTYQPNAGGLAIPSPPPPLPPGFVNAQQPVALPTPASPRGSSASPQPQPPSAPRATGAAESEATLPGNAPAFGAVGKPERVGVVLFDQGSAQIDPAQIEKLKPIIRQLRQSDGTLQVVGHAASRSGATEGEAAKAADFNLSLDRANAVAGILIRLGASPSQVIVTAEGDSAPVQAVAGVAGEAANQRVDIFLERNGAPAWPR